MMAMAIARPMPGIAPRTATPTRQTMDSQNSQRWMRIDSHKVGDLDQADGRSDDDRRQCGVGQVLGAGSAPASSSRATTSAPTTPVNCVRAPAASATGVRDELLLIGKP